MRLPKYGILLVLCCIFSLSGKELLCDFAKVPVSLWQGGEFGQTITKKKDGITVRFHSEKRNFAAVKPDFREEIPIFDRGHLSLELELPEYSNLKAVAVRLRDVNGEVFQWQADIKKLKGKTVHIPITAENFQYSYGKKANKKMDFPLRLHTILLYAAAGSGPLEVKLKQFRGEFFTASALDKVVFDLETGTASRVLIPKGQPLEFLFFNPGMDALDADAEVTFSDWQETRTVVEKFKLHMPKQDIVRRVSTIKLPCYGIWRVRARLSTPDGKTCAEHVRSLAYMFPAGAPENKNPDDFIFGVCIPNYTPASIYPKEAETAYLCGATALRLNFRWRVLEKKPGKWDFTMLDSFTGEFEKRGIEIMPILSNPPKWARKDTPNSLPHKNEWRKYTETLFRRYKDRIRFWEIWNEPDLVSFCEFSAPEYVELQKIAREEQRKCCPDAKLLTGGFATMYERTTKKGFQEYSLKHGRGSYDVHAFHGHGGFEHYSRQIETLFLPMRRKLNITEPWFANETAVSSYGIGETEQGIILFKKFLYSWANGAIGYNWYNLRNNGFIVNNPEHNYGLVTCDFYPKTAYVVYNTLATLYRGKKFMRALPSESGARIYEFASSRNILFGGWADPLKEKHEENAVFYSDAQSVSSIDLMGNPESVPHENGLLIYCFGHTPASLLFSEASEVKYLGALISAEMTEPVIAGRKQGVVILTFFNPFPSSRDFIFSLTQGYGSKLSNLPEKLTLSAGERRKLRLNVIPASGVQTLSSPRLSVTVNGRKYSIAVPIKQGIFIPQKARKENWDFILKESKQTHSLFYADPNNLDKVWMGPKDLSANISMEVRDGKWLLRYAVTDNEHVQPYSGKQVWNGDNVQIAFRLSGQQELWVAGMTLLKNGKPEVWIWDSPPSFAAAAVAGQWSLKASRKGCVTFYDLTIPLKSIGMTEELMARGIRFTTLINDNDGYGRKGWIQLAPGIAGNRNPDIFPLLVFETKK